MSQQQYKNFSSSSLSCSSSSGEFVSDVDLMFSNCLQYNPRHTNEAKAGLRLQKFFMSELVKLGLSDHTSSPPPAKRSRH